jgi:hypothetical protein
VLLSLHINKHELNRITIIVISVAITKASIITINVIANWDKENVNLRSWCKRRTPVLSFVNISQTPSLHEALLWKLRIRYLPCKLNIFREFAPCLILLWRTKPVVAIHSHSVSWLISLLKERRVLIFYTRTDYRLLRKGSALLESLPFYKFAFQHLKTTISPLHIISSKFSEKDLQVPNVIANHSLGTVDL